MKIKPRCILIVQARMGSSRLPGKSILPLANEPLLHRIIERLKRCEHIDDLVIAVPDSYENKVLIDIAIKNNTNFFAGSENNLIERYYHAALKYSADHIIRFPADNPVPEPSEIDRLICFHLKNNINGFSSNISSFYDSGYPDGIGAEIFPFQKLEEIYLIKNYDKQQMEHVHLNFFNYIEQKPFNDLWCKVQTIECPADFKRPELILDVNTKEQYLFMSELYESLYPINKNFNIKNIIDWFDNVYSKKTR